VLLEDDDPTAGACQRQRRRQSTDPEPITIAS
jgi:hypothetical protein